MGEFQSTVAYLARDVSPFVMFEGIFAFPGTKPPVILGVALIYSQVYYRIPVIMPPVSSVGFYIVPVRLGCLSETSDYYNGSVFLVSFVALHNVSGH